MAKKETAAIKKAQAAKANSSSASFSSSSSPDSILPLQPKSVTTTFNELKSAINTTTQDYFSTLTPKLKLIDLFLAFLVTLGILQFVYVLLIGNFPFNAFLGGFAICVGQFVLLVSLRLQINDSSGEEEGKETVVVKSKSKSKKKSDKGAKGAKGEKGAEDDEVDEVDEIVDVVDVDEDDTDGGKSKKVFTGISPERSFADFIFASLILHFIVIHFIN